jgi:single-stranded DNA-binding protein
MAYEVRAGQGSAFVNKNKTEDWHAPYQGEVMLPNGDIHYLDIKPAKTKAGENWFAIKIGKQKQPKQQQNNNFVEQPKPNNKPVVKQSFDNMDDDIPF